jgi:hypothetical protein
MKTKKMLRSSAAAVSLSILFAACAGPAMTTARTESGVLGEDEFLSSPWESTNLDSVAIEDNAVLIVEVRGEGGELDPSFSAFLETELNSLQRFPVLAMSAGQGSEADVAALTDLGLLNPGGAAADQGPDVIYRIELQAIPNKMPLCDFTSTGTRATRTSGDSNPTVVGRLCGARGPSAVDPSGFRSL